MAGTHLVADLRAERDLRSGNDSNAPRGASELLDAEHAGNDGEAGLHCSCHDVASRNAAQSSTSEQALPEADTMPARASRPATPPPPSADYARFGAVVSMPRWTAPVEPTDRELTAFDQLCEQHVAEQRFTVALAELQADLRSRGSVPLRKPRREVQRHA